MDAVFPLDSHFMVYFITWEMHMFSHQLGKRQSNPFNGESLRNWFLVIFYKTHCMWKTWEIGADTFPIDVHGCFFLLDSHPMAYFIAWKVHGFLIKFPIALAKSVKSNEWERLGKLVPIPFP